MATGFHRPEMSYLQTQLKVKDEQWWTGRLELGSRLGGRIPWANRDYSNPSHRRYRP